MALLTPWALGSPRLVLCVLCGSTSSEPGGRAQIRILEPISPCPAAGGGASHDFPLSLMPLFHRCRRGVGCIHYEMVTGRPMFPGSTVKEELHLIFRLLGERAAVPRAPAGGQR